MTHAARKEQIMDSYYYGPGFYGDVADYSEDPAYGAIYDPGLANDWSIGVDPAEPTSGFGAVYDPGAYNDSTISGDPSDPTSGFGAVYDPGADNDSTISGWDDPQVDGSIYDPGLD
jgi:hypothetical protein